MSDLVLRLATFPDVDAIAALVRAAYAKWMPVIGREPRPMQADYAQKFASHRFDLLVLESILLGLIETQARPDHFWIENVAVHPDHQGRGLGRRLLAHAETLAREGGHCEIRLLTNAAFAANVALYQHIGYRITHTEPFGTGTTLYMAKPL